MMITPYNVKAFANIATRSIAELLMQGKFAVDGDSCCYLLEDGSRCAIGLLLNCPVRGDPPLHTSPNNVYPDTFLAKLRDGIGFNLDDDLLRLLAHLQKMHDWTATQAGRDHPEPTLAMLQEYRADIRSKDWANHDHHNELADHFNNFLAQLTPQDFELTQYRYLGTQGTLKAYFNCTAVSQGHAYRAITKAHPGWELGEPTCHPPHTYMDEVEA